MSFAKHWQHCNKVTLGVERNGKDYCSECEHPYREGARPEMDTDTKGSWLHGKL